MMSAPRIVFLGTALGAILGGCVPLIFNQAGDWDVMVFFAAIGLFTGLGVSATLQSRRSNDAMPKDAPNSGDVLSILALRRSNLRGRYVLFGLLWLLGAVCLGLTLALLAIGIILVIIGTVGIALTALDIAKINRKIGELSRSPAKQNEIR
jgi:MFS family permease